MELEKLEELLIEVKAKIDEMHGVVYRNGLVKAVKEQRDDVKVLNERLNSFLVARDETCPYRQAVEERMKQRQSRFDTRLLVYGAIIGFISMLPDIVKLVTSSL